MPTHRRQFGLDVPFSLSMTLMVMTESGAGIRRITTRQGPHTHQRLATHLSLLFDFLMGQR